MFLWTKLLLKSIFFIDVSVRPKKNEKNKLNI